MNRLLSSLFGSASAAGALAFLAAYGEGHASAIARYLDMDLFAVQKQLEKFEAAGLLASRSAGRARMYAFDPAHPLVPELKALLDKAAALEAQSRPARTGRKPLPEALRPLFWDYPFDRLSWEADRDLVIRRLLTDGSWEALAWLRRTLGDAGLRQWLIAHQGRGLTPRQLRYWSLVLGLPRRQVDAWTRQARQGPWNRR